MEGGMGKGEKWLMDPMEGMQLALERAKSIHHRHGERVSAVGQMISSDVRIESKYHHHLILAQ